MLPPKATPLLVFHKDARDNSVWFRQSDFEDVNFAVENVLEHSLATVFQYGIGTNLAFKITPHVSHVDVHTNGVILCSRKHMRKADVGRCSTYCTYPEFVFLVNDRNTAGIFARNVTSNPRT